MFIPRSRGAEAARRICVSGLSEIWSQISRLSTLSLSFTLLRSLSCSCYITNSDFGYFPHSPSHPSSPKTYASPCLPLLNNPHTSLRVSGYALSQCLQTLANPHLPNMSEFPPQRMFLTPFPPPVRRVPATSFRPLSLAESAGRQSKARARSSGHHISKPPLLKVSDLTPSHDAHCPLTASPPSPLPGLEKYRPVETRSTRALGRYPMRNKFISGVYFALWDQHRHVNSDLMYAALQSTSSMPLANVVPPSKSEVAFSN